MERSSDIDGGTRVTHRGIRLFGRYYPTHAVFHNPSGTPFHIGARRHRKGRQPLHAVAESSAHPPLHFWSPALLGWWIAVLFMIGSFCFALGAWAASFPSAIPVPLGSGTVQNGIFFTGSLFFTAAASCQLIEARRALRRHMIHFPTPQSALALPERFAGLGYFSSAAQWIGTLLFNVNTFDALVMGGGWLEQDLAVWVPDFIGSICFLVSSHFAYLEIKVDASATALSRRIVVINYLGSAAFMLSAFCALALPVTEPAALIFFASFFTLLGAVCFFFAAYLLIPELSEN
jgi:hypothetical protein